MPAQQPTDSSAYRKLVEQIAERVWKRMQAELRAQRDRRTPRHTHNGKGT